MKPPRATCAIVTSRNKNSKRTKACQKRKKRKKSSIPKDPASSMPRLIASLPYLNTRAATLSTKYLPRTTLRLSTLSNNSIQLNTIFHFPSLHSSIHAPHSIHARSFRERERETRELTYSRDDWREREGRTIERMDDLCSIHKDILAVRGRRGVDVAMLITGRSR